VFCRWAGFGSWVHCERNWSVTSGTALKWGEGECLVFEEMRVSSGLVNFSVLGG
jgi:hypothetical protein